MIFISIAGIGAKVKLGEGMGNKLISVQAIKAKSAYLGSTC